jgi:muramoyltetrapeptide carboxypeptidase LdcA involved in peptidoglycan recycling
MPLAFAYPPKPGPGDVVAVISPSGRSAAQFPAPFDLGLARLREEFGLVAVEYPTTRAAQASPEDRAKDVHAAFSDPDIKAVIAAIGGEDELKVLPHLNLDVLAGNPKPFLGYSDNTNLHLLLWNLGMVSYHGGSVMIEFARPGQMNPLTRQSLHRALFTRDTCTLEQPGEYNDQEQHRWDEPETLAVEPAMTPADPWSWHGPAANVTGPAFGGSLEIIDFHLRTGRYLLPDDSYDGAILFLETSEELPAASYVYRVLMCMGERGLLQRFAAIVWARPKAWAFDHLNDLAAKARYTASQRDAVLAAVAEYHRGAPVVFGVDFGHTDPQHVIPSGGTVTVDSQTQQIQVTY